MSEETTLTLDQAAEIDFADEGAGNLVPVQQPAQEDHYDPPYEPEGELHTDNALTLDQAVALYDDGENEDGNRKAAPQSAAAVIDGKTVTMADLVQGYVSWRRAMHFVSRLEEEYEAVQAAADGVVSSAWELSRFMVGQMPPEPDMWLLQMNPDEYVRMKAQHDQALGSVHHVLGQAQHARASASALQERYRDMNLQTENARLVQHFPETADTNQRHAFFNRMLDVAAACGFNRAEFEQVVDHRIFRLGALALKGMEAIAEPPKTKERRRHRRQRYSDAMEKLARTGSIEDALAIDFE